MKNNLIKKLFYDARNVRLEKEKKNSIRESVLQFTKTHPYELQKSSNRGVFANIFRFKAAGITVFALLFVVLIGGIANAGAQSSLPGDPLYPVKLGSEQVLSILAFSQQAKTDLSVKLANTRLYEIEKLTTENKITPQNQAQIDNSLKNYTDSAVKNIDKLNNSKMYNAASKASSDLQASLTAHKHILTGIKDGKTKSNVDNIINNIDSVTSKLKSHDSHKNKKHK